MMLKQFITNTTDLIQINIKFSESSSNTSNIKGNKEFWGSRSEEQQFKESKNGPTGAFGEL